MHKIAWLLACGLLLSAAASVSADNRAVHSASAHMERAAAQLHAGEYEAATAEYQQALKLDPGLQDAQRMLNRIEAGAALREKNFSAAESAKQQGEHRLAVRFYTKLLESDALAGARYPLFVTYYNRGNSYLAQRDAFAAIKDYNQAIELNPKFASSYYNRGNAYSMVGKFESGIADYTKVIELQPEFAAAFFNRANARVNLREYKLAIADYQKALELKPGWERAEQSLREARSFQQIYGRFREGIEAEKRGAFDRAAAIYSEVLDSGKLDSKNRATIYYARARIHMRKNNYPATIKDLKRASELHPQWAAVKKTLQAVEAEAADIEQKLGKGALESFASPEQEEGREDVAQTATKPKPELNLPQPGTVVVDCEGCPELVVIPRSQFRATPPIAVGKYELTVAQWNICVDEGGCSFRPTDSGAERGSFPVAGVSWEDAHAYLVWLSQKSGHPYRLLSESEWEYAARAGSSTLRYWGDSPEGCEYANGADRTLSKNRRGSDTAECSDGQVRAAPVGGYQPNGYGLYDTLGNVAEWVEDCSIPGGVESATDEEGVTACSHHPVRGGSWQSSPEHMHAMARIFLRSGMRSDTVGFRVARELSPTVSADSEPGSDIEGEQQEHTKPPPN